MSKSLKPQKLFSRLVLMIESSVQDGPFCQVQSHIYQPGMKPSQHLDVLFERCPGQRDQQRCLRVLLRYTCTCILYYMYMTVSATRYKCTCGFIHNIFYFSFSARLALQLLRRLQCRNSSWLLHLLLNM